MNIQTQNDIQLEDNQIYIELPDWAQSNISDNQLLIYDGKFSLDIEKENRKKVIKYAFGFISLALLLIIILISMLSPFQEEQEDSSQYQEIQVDDKEMQRINDEIEIRYHQGCIQEEEREKNCRQCIYDTNIEQQYLKMCNLCCYSCLPTQFYTPQQYCIIQVIEVFVSIQGTISFQSELSIPDQEYIEQIITVDHLIQIIQQSFQWKHLSITFNYGSLFVSQINFFKEILSFLNKVLNSLSETLESFELHAGYISIKDDIYGKPLFYHTQFIYEDILKNLSLSKLKKINLNLTEINAVYQDNILNYFTEIIKNSSSIQMISLLVKSNPEQRQKFTQNSFSKFHQAIKNCQNLQQIEIQLPLLQNDIFSEITNLIDSLQNLNEFKGLNLCLNLENQNQFSLLLGSIGQLVKLTSLLLDIQPTYLSEKEEYFTQIQELQQLNLTFRNIEKINQIIFQNLKNSKKIQSLKILIESNSQNLVLGDQIIIAIGQLIKSQTNLESISLEFQCQDTFTDLGLEQLLSSLPKNSLKQLEFSAQYTQFSDKRFQQLIQQLELNQNLIQFQLNLNKNQNLSKENYNLLCKTLSTQKFLQRLYLQVKSSNIILNDDEHSAKLIFKYLTSPLQLNTLHIYFKEISQAQIIDLLAIVQNTNIIDLKFIANYLIESSNKLNITTSLKELKYNQNFVNFHLEIENRQLFDDEYCSYIINPLIRQIRLQGYTILIGCEYTQSQFDKYLKIHENLKSDKNIIINQDQFYNITDVQFLELFRSKDVNFDNIKILSLELKDQISLNETSISAFHQLLGQTVNQYKLIAPQNQNFSLNLIRNISHFCALQFNLKTFSLEVKYLDYNIESIQIFFHSLSTSMNKISNNVEIILPCNIYPQEIQEIGSNFQLLTRFNLQFNNCNFQLSQQQINDIQQSFLSNEITYINNILIIKKIIKKTDDTK